MDYKLDPLIFAFRTALILHGIDVCSSAYLGFNKWLFKLVLPSYKLNTV